MEETMETLAKEKRTKLTIMIDEEIAKQTKKRAIDEGIPTNKLVQKALEQYLERNEEIAAKDKD
jgi:predicted DNA binding CopG/RHH family protein